jgi:hypothetical protein
MLDMHLFVGRREYVPIHSFTLLVQSDADRIGSIQGACYANTLDGDPRCSVHQG